MPSPPPATRSSARSLGGIGDRRATVVAVLSAGGATNDLAGNLALWAGAGLMVVSAGIHLHLWLGAYQHIPTIGPLFLTQAIVAVVLAVAVAVLRRLWAVVAAFGFTAATIGGFLITVDVGLFGFQDSWAAPFAGLAFGVEVAALVLLAAGAALALRSSMARR